MSQKPEKKYFLPYQIRWLKDKSKIKIWEKSRRIGATYVQAYEDVRDCIDGTVPAVWFSSADESAAREYIYYCTQWAKLFDTSARDLGETILEEEKIKTFTIQFENSSRINALSSNPKAFRSKGGKVVLDEFAFHNDQFALWKAAAPVITWGFPLRILSTHHGKNNLFYKFIESVEQKKLDWSHHKTSIFNAVDDGLVDKLYKRRTTKKEREQWLDDIRKNCFDEATWLEEYCCIPVDESTSFLSYDLIFGCERELNISLPDAKNIYLGFDIGRKKDLSVIYILEELNGILITAEIKVMEKMPFNAQREILFKYLSLPAVHRACIDSTGLGMQLAEEAQQRFGKFRIEPIMFTPKVKEELAYDLLTRFQDKTIFIPPDNDLREDLHSIRKVVTSSNNIRFDVTQSETSGHADRFWALALAIHAAKSSAGPVFAKSSHKLSSYKLIERFL
ncbi:MAG TPA: terminase family protein [Bacteroidota bacterium]|nr:terminase family protein [Bacteroidota bacterium]